MSELWLDNKPKKKNGNGKESRPRVRIMKSKKRGKLGKRSPFKGFTINKGRETNMARKAKRKRTRSRRRRNPIAVYNRPRSRRRRRRNPVRAIAMNRPYRRRSRSGRRRRNNPPAFRNLMQPVMYAALGHVATKFAVGAVLPAINIPAAPASLTSMLAKSAVAYGIAWAGEKFIGSSTFEPLFLGGMSSVIQDFVAVYVAPSIPALAGDDNFMNAYAFNQIPVQQNGMLGAYYSNDMALDETV